MFLLLGDVVRKHLKLLDLGYSCHLSDLLSLAPLAKVRPAGSSCFLSVPSSDHPIGEPKSPVCGRTTNALGKNLHNRFLFLLLHQVTFYARVEVHFRKRVLPAN